MSSEQKALKDTISITLDGPILKEVRELAAVEDRSVSSYINLVLKAHLEQLHKGKKARRE